MARFGLEDSSLESDNDDVLIDTEGRGGEMDKATAEEKMENYMHIIRNFWDGLEHQVKFQDKHFSRTLERNGAGFFRLAQNCFSRERLYVSSQVGSPTTWERSTANAMFYSCFISPVLLAILSMPTSPPPKHHVFISRDQHYTIFVVEWPKKNIYVMSQAKYVK